LVPVSITFIRRPEWKLQHMLEIVGHHHLPLTMGEPVGMQRHHRTAQNREQAETRPGAHQHHEVRPGQFGEMALRVRQGVDDAAEQDRLHEDREGERHVRDGQDPAQASLAPEQLENAKVKTQKLHGVDAVNMREIHCSGNSSCRNDGYAGATGSILL
jgi:hypothetical protein